MTVTDYVYEAGQEEADFASRGDKYLDGKGSVIKEVAFGKDDAQDIVEHEISTNWGDSRNNPGRIATA